MAKRTKTTKPTSATPTRPLPERKSVDYAQVVRIVREWTPSRIRQAKRNAEGGDLSLAAAVCDQLLFPDDRVKSGLDAQLEQLFALTPSFEKSGDRRRSGRPVKALEAGDDWWRGYPEAELRQIVKWSLGLGIGLGRHRWTERPDHGNRLLPMLELWHPQGLRWHHDEQRWTIRNHRGIELDVVPGDGTWVMHLPFGKSRPWAEGYWYCLSILLLLKYYSIIDSGRVGGRLSMLVARGQAPEVELTKELRKDLATALADALEEGGPMVAALPAGLLLEAVKVGEGAAELFEAHTDLANDAISIVIRGGNLSTKVEGGSRAAAESQAKQNEVPKLRYHAEALATTLHDQSLEPWALFNFGDASLAPWPSWPTEPEEDRKVRAEGFTVVATMVEKLEAQGFQLDDKAVIDDFGLNSFVKGRKDEATRRQEAAERFAQMQPPGSGLPAKDDPKDPKAAPKPPAKKDDKAAKQHGNGGIARLASGDTATSAPAFIATQLFIDDLVQSASTAANQAIEQTVEEILEEVDAAESLVEIYERLRARYASMDSGDLRELTYRIAMIGELAGRFAVTADT